MIGRRAALQVGLAGAFCAVVLGGCGDEGPFAPEVENGYFGINGQALRPLAGEGRLAELTRHLDAIAGGGVDFVRANIDWTRIEPGPPQAGRHDYDFSGTDAFMRALAEHELSWQLTAVGIPPRGGPRRPRTTPPAASRRRPRGLTTWSPWSARGPGATGAAGTSGARTAMCRTGPWSSTRSGTSRTSARSGAPSRTPRRMRSCSSTRLRRSIAPTRGRRS